MGDMKIDLDLSPETLESLATVLAERVAQRLLAETDTQPDRWMDSAAAATYLGLTRDALHKLSAANAVPFSQDVPNGKLYFQKSQLDRWRMASSTGQRN